MTPPASGDVTVTTDGSCLGGAGQGPGGYAALIVADGVERVVTGRAAAATIGAMELTAVIAALETLPPGAAVTVRSDSRAVIDGITQRLPWWRSRRWRTLKGGKVADRDLWQRLASLAADRTVTWVWLKGHAGDPDNERAHALAYAEARAAAEDRARG
ncbi:MAG TPA: ribonuclease H [Microvirga sp.]|jgi:ribonuclease HI